MSFEITNRDNTRAVSKFGDSSRNMGNDYACMRYVDRCCGSTTYETFAHNSLKTEFFYAIPMSVERRMGE